MAPPFHAQSSKASATAVVLSLVVSSSLFPFASALVPTNGFFCARSSSFSSRRAPVRSRRSYSSGAGAGGALRMNFLSDMFKGAFENDPNLSSDASQGQLEGPGIDEGRTSSDLTETQKRFLSSSQGRPRSSVRAEGGGAGGAPVDPALLAGTEWTLDLYLSGIPSKDPSNDLYGRRINISNRDRAASGNTGMSETMSEPTVTLSVTLREDGTCSASRSEFTSGEKDGEWKLSEDNRYLRLSIDALGYTRTVRTKGTIQKVFWSDSDEVTTKTSTSYTIPPGYIYGDVALGYGLPGELVMKKGTGTVRVERVGGLLGASSTMVTCGKFEGKMTTKAATAATSDTRSKSMKAEGKTSGAL